MQTMQSPSTSGRTAAPRGRPSRLDVSARFALPTLFVDKKVQRADTKSKLLEAIKPLKRGVLADEQDRAAVESLAQELERLNPTPKPLASPLINGKWQLLYTTSQTVLGLNKPAPFRPSGPIYQVIDAAALRARNIEGAPFFNQVSADLEPLSASKVAVQFDEFRIFNLFGVKAPPTARGELAITYLDEDLRLSRGDKGNLFILAMEDREFKP